MTETQKSRQKQASRERILDSAAERLRASGAEGVGIKDIMASAGLTHGGFYAHFPDKTALVASAFERAMDQGRADWFRDLDGAPPATRLTRLIERYLSERHRDDPANGCPWPTLGADMARLGDPAGDAAARSFGKTVDLLAEDIAAVTSATPTETERQEAADRAAALLALMAGGMTLARAVGDTARSRSILAACRASAFSVAFGAPPRPHDQGADHADLR